MLEVARSSRPAAVTMEPYSLTAADGFSLSAARWLPATTPRALLYIAHGMSEHKARYADFAAACTAAGIAVYAHDHRGHGGSTDASTPLGHFADNDGWNKVVHDLHLGILHARRQHPGVPTILFGHSMGSFITRGYLLAHPETLAGAIISATGFRFGPGNLVLQNVARREVHKHGKRAPSPLMAKLVFGSFNAQFVPTREPFADGADASALARLAFSLVNFRLAPNRTEFDWLSRDPQTVDKYVADPLCGFDCTGRLWDDLMGGVFTVERAEADPSRLPAVPLLLLAGSRDPVSMGGRGSAQLAKAYRAAGNPDVTDKRYPDGRHELLNETNRAEVYADTIAWILRHA